MHPSSFADINPSELGQPTRCATAAKPTGAEKHKREMLRFVVVVVAFLAVLLLLAIALYYTQGNSVTVKHVSSLRPYLSYRAGA